MVDTEHNYYDLNISLPEKDPSTNPTLLKLIRSIISNGYTGFALNVFKRAPLIEKELITIPKLNITSIMKDSLPSSIDLDFSTVEQYNRITVEISDQKHIPIFNETNKIYKIYDIIAVRPTNERLFLQSCSQIDCDIISLDLSEKLGFFIKKQNVWEAIARGVTFEITYGKALTDTAKRKHLFRNAIALAEICRGKNLIISSEVNEDVSHRSPLDVQMMSLLLGVKEKYKHMIIEDNCKIAIAKASKCSCKR